MLRCSPFPNMVLKSGLLRKTENVPTENVHQFAMNRLMGVGWRNPSNIIYAEFGRFPIYLNSYTKCIRYWLKLTMNTISRLPLKVYYIVYNVDCKDKSILVLKVWVCMAFHMHGKLKHCSLFSVLRTKDHWLYMTRLGWSLFKAVTGSPSIKYLRHQL